MNPYILAICGLVSIVAIFWLSNESARLSVMKLGILQAAAQTVHRFFLVGFFILYSLLGVIGYLLVSQRTAVPQNNLVQQPSVPSESATSSSSSFSNSALPDETPKINKIEVSGYVRHQQNINEEIDYQRKEIEKHYMRSKELERKIYITSDDSSIEELPEEPKREETLPQTVISNSVKNEREVDHQDNKDVVKNKNKSHEEPELSHERQKREQKPVKADEQQSDNIAARKFFPDERKQQIPSVSDKLCNEIQKIIFIQYNQIIFKNPVGQPTFLKGPAGIVVITPKAHRGNCVEYDIQVGEGEDAAHCRNIAKMCLN